MTLSSSLWPGPVHQVQNFCGIKITNVSWQCNNDCIPSFLPNSSIFVSFNCIGLKTPWNTCVQYKDPALRALVSLACPQNSSPGISAIISWKFRLFPRVNISVKIIFIIRTKNRENRKTPLRSNPHYGNNFDWYSRHFPKMAPLDRKVTFGNFTCTF